jgi:hypothetical protein
MEQIASDFFQNLFSKDDALEPEIIANLVQACIDDEMNRILCAAFTKQEIGDLMASLGAFCNGTGGF